MSDKCPVERIVGFSSPDEWGERIIADWHEWRMAEDWATSPFYCIFCRATTAG